LSAADQELKEQGLPAAGLPAVFAYGDPDDAYRLCGALASMARSETDIKPLVSLCHSRGSSWDERLGAIEGLLEAGALERVIFVDPDALFPGVIEDASRWSDSLMRRERDELFKVLLRSGLRHGWRFVRTQPTASGLPETAAETYPEPSPELRPSARWLRERGLLPPKAWSADLTREDIDHLVLAALADTLDSELEGAAMRLALVRPVQTVNGTVGPYPKAGGERAVPIVHLSELAARGVVALKGHEFRMPRRFRSHFLALAEAVGPFDSTEEHRWLARRPNSPMVEKHFHAVVGGEVQVAMDTGAWYTNDLRLSTFRLTAQGKYKEAAALYDFIRRADSRDSYAHEYYAWSLWCNRTWENDLTERRLIRDAYAQAHALDPGNPLYHGRYLGFRAQCGENVTLELAREVRRMTTEGRSEVTIKWFTHPVVKGIVSGPREQDMVTLEREFGKRRTRSWLSLPPGKVDFAEV
jgi:hypothetical protein